MLSAVQKNSERRVIHVCGIIGYTGTADAVQRILEGLSSLEYRGYDSAGIAVFDGGELKTVKAAGRLDALKERIGELSDTLVSGCGVGHTRWATHGAPNDTNAHPHGTCAVQIVHNGIIGNFAELRGMLKDKGYDFYSQTDTEAAAKLTDLFYSETHDPILALRRTAEQLRGSYAIGAVFADRPGEIYALKRESPLIAACGADGNYIMSDMSAVAGHADEFYRLADGELAVVSRDGINFYSESGENVEKTPERSVITAEAVSKCGYPHFMLKEIHEEPQAVMRTVSGAVRRGLPCIGGNVLTDMRLASFEHIYMIGCGTAMHAGLVGKYAIERLARVPVSVEIASEFRCREPIIGKNELAVVISQSGETADTVAAMRLAKSRGAYILAVVNVPGSVIATEADCVIYTLAGPEIAVASTKAYEVQLAALYLLSLRLAHVRGSVPEEEIRSFAAELESGVPEAIARALELDGICTETARSISGAESIFFIGRGADYAICAESALKLKEISYIHCEAYAAGELKHGTISLISDGTPVFAFLTQESLCDKMLSSIDEVRCRGARVTLLCSENIKVPENAADSIIRLPQVSELFMPMPAATAAQLIAYRTALYLGRDIDKPRNLAKSVTVE